MTVIVDAPCLSAVVSGMRDEGGKGRPNKVPSVPVASVTIQDLSAMCGEVTHAAYEQPFRSPLSSFVPHSRNYCGQAGRISFGTQPRAKALGYSVMPLRGIRRVAESPIRRFAESPRRPLAVSPTRPLAHSPCRPLELKRCFV
jgi:hypothetical protein